MKTIFTLLTAVLVTVLLSGCADDDAFTLDTSSNSGTNIPAIKNFVMLFDDVNPPVISADGLTFDGGVTVQVTINAGDRLKLPTVGATAYLETQWGTLSDKTCVIEATGTCTITWTSNANFGQPFFPPDANVAFTAWILGEEDFTDIDGNNIFNNGDFFDPNPNDVPPLTAAHGDDLIGPYLDLDHDGVYTLNVDDVLVPGNSNGVITQPDQLYNGQNCTHPTLCSQTTLIYISHHVVLPIQEDATAAPALSVTIDVPANNTTVANGNNVTFTATATDPEDGTILGTNNPLPGNDIVWSSDQDGLLSNNNITSVTVNDLSINTHVITVTVTDSNGNTATDTITIVIN